MSTERAAADREVLIVASPPDAAVVASALAQTGLASRVCAGAQSLRDEIHAGAGVLFLAEEVVKAADIRGLGELLGAQPEWSDLPVILLAVANHDAGPLIESLCRNASHHVSVLERPIRSSTLQAAVQAAMRSRERQYQVRDELARRQRAEDALRASEERLRLAAEAAHFGTYDADLLSGEINATLETRRILGFPDGSAQPMPAGALLDQIHPEDRQYVLDAMAASFDPQGPGVIDEEHRVALPDGTIRWIMVRGRTTFEGEAGARRAVRSTGTMIDITKRKEAEQQLKEADRRKDRFLATLAHELRNPLAALRISLDVIQMGDVGEARASKSCAIMERQLEALVQLVDDLVDVSRVIQGKMQLQTRRVDLESIVQRAVEDSAVFVDEAGQHLSVSLPPRPVLLDADPIRLAQVFSNLLSNAAKYTPEGGHIELSAELEKGAVRVSVRDDGFGIPNDKMDTIFEMFSQAHGPLERGHKGLGIGLSLSKSLVEMHGGAIDAHSSGPGKGSRFDVTLPVADVGRVPSSRKNDAGVAGRAKDFRRRVLVVDDNRDAAHSLADWMTLHGHEVRCAFDGAEALEVAACFRPHLVLLDIGLPKMSGYDVARHIRSHGWGKGMVLAAVSGWGRDADREEAVQAGFDRHITKPPQPESLRDLLTMVSALDGQRTAKTQRQRDSGRST